MHLVKENRTCKGAIISDSRHPENLNFKTANKFVPGVGHELQISNYKGILTMYFKFGIICRDSARNSN